MSEGKIRDREFAELAFLIAEYLIIRTGRWSRNDAQEEAIKLIERLNEKEKP